MKDSYGKLFTSFYKKGKAFNRSSTITSLKNAKASLYITSSRMGVMGNFNGLKLQCVVTFSSKKIMCDFGLGITLFGEFSKLSSKLMGFVFNKGSAFIGMITRNPGKIITAFNVNNVKKMGNSVKKALKSINKKNTEKFLKKYAKKFSKTVKNAAETLLNVGKSLWDGFTSLF